MKGQINEGSVICVFEAHMCLHPSGFGREGRICSRFYLTQVPAQPLLGVFCSLSKSRIGIMTKFQQNVQMVSTTLKHVFQYLKMGRFSDRNVEKYSWSPVPVSLHVWFVLCV